MSENIKLDQWQKDVLAETGNICLCSGRQVGKSTVISMKAGEFAIKNKKKNVMVIAATERQAYLLFEKILAYIYDNYKKEIKTGKDRPTKHIIQLKNGSKIYCLPTGDSGYGIRGYTIDDLYADEAHFIKEEVWAAVTPMLATTGGRINLLSTPFGAQGYFFRCFHSNNFRSFHISTEDVAKSRQEPQRTSMLNHLKEEKLSMSKLQYQQEYLGMFVGGIMRLFPDEIIDKCAKIEKPTIPRHDKFMGIDVARMGGDDTVLCSADRITKTHLKMFDLSITTNTYLTDTSRLILHKDSNYNYKKIYIDDGGLGAGVYDYLFEHPQTKRKIVGLNNAKKSIDKDKDKNRTKRILKHDLYANLVRMMENGEIELLDIPELKQSLRSMQYEYSDDKTIRIYGNYSHIAEALVRMAWCVKDKSLNIYFYS